MLASGKVLHTGWNALAEAVISSAVDKSSAMPMVESRRGTANMGGDGRPIDALTGVKTRDTGVCVDTCTDMCMDAR